MKFFKMPVTVKFDEIVKFDGMSRNMIDQYSAFPRSNDGIPLIYDYMLTAYFKDICRELQKWYRCICYRMWTGCINDLGGELQRLYLYGLSAQEATDYCKKMYYNIFIEDRVNPIILPEGLDEGSDPCKIPTGAICFFTVIAVDTRGLDLVKEWLSYKHPNSVFGDITEVEIEKR